jgi:hypothetical protein
VQPSREAFDERHYLVRVLIVSTPASGHLNPLLSVGRALLSHGHEVVVLSAHALRELVEDIGATFRGFPPGADFDWRNIDAVFPEVKDLRPGTELNLFILSKAHVDPIPAQYEGIQHSCTTFQPMSFWLTISSLVPCRCCSVLDRSGHPSLCSA